MTRLSRFIYLIGLSVIVLLLWQIAVRFSSEPQSEGSANSLYVWNRSWSNEVLQGIRESAGKVAGYVVLAGQVEWEGSTLRVTSVGCDYAALAKTGKAVGIAIRVGAYSGPFASEEEPFDTIVSLASTVLSDASCEGLKIREIQIDFDCPESKLDGYRVWIKGLKKVFPDVPVTITALPTWLKHEEFKQLAKETDGYVLQVHSLETAKTIHDPITLFQGEKARRWVQEAGKRGLPFRVSLPTYGYQIAFDEDGMYAGIFAEGPRREWPEGVRVREVRTDPKAVAEFVRWLDEKHPKNMKGLLWFRLPTQEDRLNWRWPTLAAVMEGRVPEPNLLPQVRKPEPELVDITLKNTGEADSTQPITLSVRWQGSRLLAADALAGFRLANTSPDELTFYSSRNGSSPRIYPSEEVPVGWLRFDTATEVQVDVLAQQ